MSRTSRPLKRVDVVVLGLGNPLRRDDAVGLKIAAEVERMLLEKPRAGVRVLTSARAGFELIDLLAGATHAVIVDCLELPRPTPGKVHRLTLDAFAGSARLVGMHEISVADALELARRLKIQMPRTVEIIAVEGLDTYTLSEEMDPRVAAAVEPAARSVLSTVTRWVSAPRRRSAAAALRRPRSRSTARRHTAE
jgi:hydrogenase maturation protease